MANIALQFENIAAMRRHYAGKWYIPKFYRRWQEARFRKANRALRASRGDIVRHERS